MHNKHTANINVPLFECLFTCMSANHCRHAKLHRLFHLKCCVGKGDVVSRGLPKRTRHAGIAWPCQSCANRQLVLCQRRRSGRAGNSAALLLCRLAAAAYRGSVFHPQSCRWHLFWCAPPSSTCRYVLFNSIQVCNLPWVFLGHKHADGTSSCAPY